MQQRSFFINQGNYHQQEEEREGSNDCKGVQYLHCLSPCEQPDPVGEHINHRALFQTNNFYRPNVKKGWPFGGKISRN